MNNAKSPIYNSECLSNTCKFDKVKIPASLLGNGIILDFFNSKNKLVAEIPTNVEELIKKNFYVKPHKSRTYAITSNSFLTRNYIFIDYLKAGVQIGLSIAIDFTGSNGAPNQKTSLHYLGGEPNQYERAIYACGNIMAYYDYDQLFPCYGFCAKINNKSAQLFNLNFQPDPNIYNSKCH